jgi:ring-1,2-phenylacetyl-CoA epoxidase subunit PaaD
MIVEGAIVRARRAAASVTDPEMPMLTLVELGMLRGVHQDADGTVIVIVTPTYSACPALTTMREDLKRALSSAGFEKVEVRISLAPAWTSDWITVAGRRKLREHGIAPPSALRPHHPGPIPLTLFPRGARPQCPQCGSFDTEEISAFGSTACKSLSRCTSCGEPFERVKEI